MYWILLLVAVIIGIFLYINWIRRSSFRSIRSESDSSEVRKYVILSKIKPMKTSMDYMRLGCIYDYIYKSPMKAAIYYKKAAAIIDIEQPTGDDIFVLDRITDRINLDILLEEDEMPIQPYLQESDIPRLRLDRKTEEVEKKIVWKEDNNNVHDTNINGEIIERIDRIKARTPAPFSEDETIRMLNNVRMPEFEASNKEGAMKTIEHIKNFNQMLNKAMMKEFDLLRLIVADINSNYKKERRQTLYENLINNLNDATDGENTVCINGRISRMLNAYTDGELETFKSEQAWKNELFEAASKAKNTVIDSLPENDKDVYNNDIAGENLQRIQNKIAEEMKSAVVEIDAPSGVKSDVFEELKYCL